MTKKNIIIARIPLLILGIAIGIGLSIGIAKAQPVSLKDRSLKQKTLSLKELKGVKEFVALKNVKDAREVVALKELKSGRDLKVSRDLKNLKSLKSLSASLLQNHPDASVKDDVPATSVRHLELKVGLDNKLTAAADSLHLHGNLDVLGLTA